MVIACLIVSHVSGPNATSPHSLSNKTKRLHVIKLNPLDLTRKYEQNIWFVTKLVSMKLIIQIKISGD